MKASIANSVTSISHEHAVQSHPCLFRGLRHSSNMPVATNIATFATTTATAAMASIEAFTTAARFNRVSSPASSQGFGATAMSILTSYKEISTTMVSSKGV